MVAMWVMVRNLFRLPKFDRGKDYQPFVLEELSGQEPIVHDKSWLRQTLVVATAVEIELIRIESV